MERKSKETFSNNRSLFFTNENPQFMSRLSESSSQTYDSERKIFVVRRAQSADTQTDHHHARSQRNTHKRERELKMK